VQLAKGEQVTVIGRSEREGPDGPQLWYRIVPPSGEYRWIHRQTVVDSSEALVELARQSGSRKDSALDISDGRETIASSQPIREDAFSDRGDSVLENENRVGSGLKRSAATSRAMQVDGDGLSYGGIQQAGNLRDLAIEESSQPQTAMDAFREGGLVASLEFITRPRIQEIGAQPQTDAFNLNQPVQAPGSQVVANDSNWISGQNRFEGIRPSMDSNRGQSSNVVTSDGFTAADRASGYPGGVRTVSGTIPMDTSVLVARVENVKREVAGSDADRLNLILSRLMASQANEAEIAVVADAANRLALQSVDQVTAGRARLIVETAERYRRVALRRDGGVVVASADSIASVPVRPSVGNAERSPQPTASSQFIGESNSSNPKVTTGSIIRHDGYLVQVYSARSNSPPFALADSAGRTVAYLTPMPGVNLRTHLNHQISVVGTAGYVTGLTTPHLMVTQVVRTTE
ncbi:hypothetical protein OAA27_02575, partial [bacterium]|nr:hypothetical protein [bacterium]